MNDPSRPSMDLHTDKILILDFGAQYTQLIARRIRELGVYCEVWAWDHDPDEIATFAPKGIILSGGPESTTVQGAPTAPRQVFDSGLPLLGICSGMQTMARQLGGETEKTEEHTSELQSLMRISYAVFCLKKKNKQQKQQSNAST